MPKIRHSSPIPVKLSNFNRLIASYQITKNKLLNLDENLIDLSLERFFNDYSLKVNNLGVRITSSRFEISRGVIEFIIAQQNENKPDQLSSTQN